MLSFDDNHTYFFFFYKIIASANYMLSELFQLDEPKKEESSESPLNENSDESYSEEEEEMPDSDENGSYSTSSDPSDDNKAVAIIKSVGELSVPEKYKSIHQIRVSMVKLYLSFISAKTMINWLQLASQKMAFLGHLGGAVG